MSILVAQCRSMHKDTDVELTFCVDLLLEILFAFDLAMNVHFDGD